MREHQRKEGEHNATYVRFEDESGNPLLSRNVVIKVSATTGEIIDIVSEASPMTYMKDKNDRRLEILDVTSKEQVATPATQYRFLLPCKQGVNLAA